MTKQEYYDLKERIGSRDQCGKWFNTISELLMSYPAFRNMTLTEVHEYFFNRSFELETEIRKTLNVDD